MRNSRWSTIRAYVQILFWLIFIAIILITRNALDDNTLITLIPRLSPYLWIILLITKHAISLIFFPALIIITLSIILGRFFCGWICPLGCTIDATDKLIVPPDGNIKKISQKIRQPVKIYKFLILIITLIISISGINISGIIDPLSIAVRDRKSVV